MARLVELECRSVGVPALLGGRIERQMPARLTRLLVALGLLLGAALPSAAAAVVRPPTSQEIPASPVPARGADPAYARSYFGARYLRADLGRFTTVDPAMTIKDNLVDPQRWNRYAYVTNNPLKFTDPDGRNPLLVMGGIGAAVYGGWAIYQNVSHGKAWYNNVGFEAAKGFVVGATLGAAAAGIAASGVTGTAGSHATAVSFGGNSDQVRHTFRHVAEETSLKIGAVKDAIRTDLAAKSGDWKEGLRSAYIRVDGVLLKYNAYKMKDGAINVGRITIEQDPK
jgi:RHS repeat-associated protein